MAGVPPLSLHAWLRFDAIQRLLAGKHPSSVLEIGVGQGSVGVLLARRFTYLGLEIDEVSYRTAFARFQRYGLDGQRCLVHGGLDAVEGSQFDLVCAFEVLEHFHADLETLLAWRAHVRPKGWMLISVPAGAGRFGAADTTAGHFRRYDREDAESLLAAAGLTNVEVVNYGFPLGYVLETGRNLLARRSLRRHLSPDEQTRSSGRWLQPPEGAAALMRAVALPFTFLQRPFSHRNVGTGLVVAGQTT